MTEVALLHDFTALYDKSGENNTFHVVLLLVQQRNGGFFCDPWTPFIAILLLSAFPALSDVFLARNISLHSCLSTVVVERKTFSLSRSFKRTGIQ